MIKIPRVLNSFGVWSDPVFHAMLERDMVIGVRAEFYWGGGGSLLPESFLQKKSEGGGLQPPSPLR